jgi:hypothetical protein
MATWTSHDLDTVGGAHKMETAPIRVDGTRHGYTSTWIVRIGDELSVRSYRGPNGTRYRAATRTGRERIPASRTQHAATHAAAATTLRLTPDPQGDH